jgi:hypothetical protein
MVFTFDTSSVHESWIRHVFGPPFTSQAKLINGFFFAITLISYGNICLEYTLTVPILSTTNTTSKINAPIGFDLFSSRDQLFYLPESIYVFILLVEFYVRFVYTRHVARQMLVNHLFIIDVLSIASCVTYLLFHIYSRNLPTHYPIQQCLACFRLVRLLKLSRYSAFIRQYFQTIIYHYRISLLLVTLVICLCMFFGNFMYGISFNDHSRSHSTPLNAFFHSYETILTIGFGIHSPSEAYLTCLTVASVLFGMLCLSLPVPFLAIYNFNLDSYEQEQC